MRFLCILVCIVFFSSCSEKSKTPTEASLEEAVDNASKVFSSGDAEKMADLFIVSEELTREHTLQMANAISKSDPPLKFRLMSSKVSGNIGIILLSFSGDTPRFPFFAKWEDGQWKFFLEFLAWQNSEFTKQLDLTEVEMDNALELQKWAISQPNVGASGINARDRLAWYLPYISDNLNIEQFYETPSPAMDHDYIWKIKIEDSPNFKKFVKQLTEPPSNVDGINDYSGVSQFEDHPKWWTSLDTENLEIYRYRVSVVGGAEEKAYLTVLFDRNSGYLYIHAF